MKTGIVNQWARKRVKFVFREIDDRSKDGQETLLSVSEYYGVRPRSESFGDAEFLSRAETLEGYKKCAAGDLVINIMLAWKRGLGVAPVDGIVSPAYNVFRLREKEACPGFFHYLLRTDEYLAEFTRRSTGIMDSRLRMYPDAFMDVRVHLPVPTQQRRIAACLDEATAKVDRLVTLRERQMDLLREQRAALIQQAVTRGLNPKAPLKDSGLPWLGGIPKHWILTQIKREAILISKGSTPSTIGAEFIESGIRFLKAENITGGSVSEVPSFFIDESTHNALRRSHLQPNDLLVVIAGATTGKAGVLGADLTPANANQAVCFVRFRRAQMSRFCNEWLSLSPVRDLIMQRAVQSAQPNLAMPDLGAMPIVKPPDTELDRVLTHIDEIKERFVKLLSAYERQIELLTEYRAALIYECVTGQRPVPAN